MNIIKKLLYFYTYLYTIITNMICRYLIIRRNLEMNLEEATQKIEDELDYPGQIKVHVLRETKAVEYAK